MNGIKLMLFGISVILYAGFLTLAGYGGDGILFWSMALGFAFSVGGLLTSDGDGRDDSRSDADDGGTDDGESQDGGGHYSPSRFPPM